MHQLFMRVNALISNGNIICPIILHEVTPKTLIDLCKHTIVIKT